jgi:aspartyl-tRNA(Asn)/glutamyl-tRNA(Gln) amidotransferase subunit B
VDRVPVLPAALAGLIRIVEQGTISSTVAKDVFAKMYDSGRSADDIVATDGLAQTSDTSAIVPHVRKVVDGHPEVIAEIRAGKDRKFQFLVGQVMKESRGKADPKVVTELLKQAIG